VVLDVPVALAVTAGMIATVNPCGFAMLPAYLGFFVGSDRRARSSVSAVRRALGVTAAVTAGFVVVFGSIGLVVSTVAESRRSRW
jgi:cytochrome c biogenesis protein CcdA